ncbi:hypothetical protein BpHYR1_033317 [Brachionus plicatilis]|uniref:Uncharacterized protein n=1 Tax=Brachionus plicatilis TaxID=10195 RepID=A0A3M7SJD5_BRAPC|nr:hypothetical protein BpHYR1_033317 [Brachionus plicatilis]
MKEYKKFVENQSLINYSRENLYHLKVHDIGNQSDDGRTLKMTYPMLLQFFNALSPDYYTLKNSEFTKIYLFQLEEDRSIAILEHVAFKTNN